MSKVVDVYVGLASANMYFEVLRRDPATGVYQPGRVYTNSMTKKHNQQFRRELVEKQTAAGLVVEGVRSFFDARRTYFEDHYTRGAQVTPEDFRSPDFKLQALYVQRNLFSADEVGVQSYKVLKEEAAEGHVFRAVLKTEAHKAKVDAMFARADAGAFGAEMPKWSGAEAQDTFRRDLFKVFGLDRSNHDQLSTFLAAYEAAWRVANWDSWKGVTRAFDEQLRAMDYVKP